MGSEGFVVVGIGIYLGFLMIKLLPKTKWGKKIIDRMDHRDTVLNNPELLVKKLKEGAGYVDEGMEMNYSVVEKDGKKVVALDLKKEKGAAAKEVAAKKAAEREEAEKTAAEKKAKGGRKKNVQPKPKKR